MRLSNATNIFWYRKYKMLLELIYYSGLSFSFVCVNLSDACPLGSFLIFGCFTSPRSTVGLHWAVVCANATCVAFADPLTILYSLSSRCLIDNHSVSSSSLDSSLPCDNSLSFMEHKCIDWNAV